MANSEQTTRMGRAIRALRTAADMSQDDLAAATGISQSGITRLEQGSQEMPLGKLALIAEFFGCSLGELVDGRIESATGPAVRIAVSAEVECLTHGLLAKGLTDKGARELRIAHLHEHSAARDG